MARIEIDVKYNVDTDVSEILSETQKYLDMSEDKDKVRNLIKGKLQQAFDDGRRFQKNHSDLELI